MLLQGDCLDLMMGPLYYWRGKGDLHLIRGHRTRPPNNSHASFAWSDVDALLLSYSLKVSLKLKCRRFSLRGGLRLLFRCGRKLLGELCPAP